MDGEMVVRRRYRSRNRNRASSLSLHSETPPKPPLMDVAVTDPCFRRRLRIFSKKGVWVSKIIRLGDRKKRYGGVDGGDGGDGDDGAEGGGGGAVGII
ncbi:hypothetical protein Hanom_Chr09g00858631 [Helianthus anomalus]